MNFPWSRQVMQTFAWEIVAIAVLFVALALWQRRRGQPSAARRSFIAGGSAAVVVLVALVLSFTVAPNLPSPPVPFFARFASNPVADTPATASATRPLYQERCAVCHGPNGLGDGAAALTLNPRPVNLRLHVPQHADGEIFYWISEGVAGTAMPAWKGTLSEEERWRLVVYLRALARGEP